MTKKYPGSYYPKRTEELNNLILNIKNYKYTEGAETLNDMIKLCEYIEKIEEDIADMSFHWS